jgi:hypothetical protein
MLYIYDMQGIFKIWLLKWHTWLNKLLIKYVDVNESNVIVKVVTKKIGLSWIDMVNHVEVSNQFFIPYKLVEVKLTYYNDAQQNVGYLHFNEPVKIGAHSKKIVQMPAKMSNITALFNMVRLMITDDIKTRTVGTTTIQILGIKFELPIDTIMVIDRDKLVLEEEEDRQKRLADREKREQERVARFTENEEKRKSRLARMAEKREEEKAKLIARLNAQKEKIEQKKAARARLQRMKQRKWEQNGAVTENLAEDIIKEPQENSAARDNSSVD